MEVISILKEDVNLAETLYIGLGRSPSLIVELMKIENSQNVLTLPLSGFRHNIHSDNQALSNELPPRNPALEKLSKNNEEKLFRYFTRFFDSNLKNLSSFKKIIIFDYAQSGKSLFSATKYLEKYLEKNKLNIKVEPNALGKKISKWRLEKNAFKYRVDEYYFINFRTKHFKSQKYDKWAEYLRFDVKIEAYPDKNPKYSQLSKAVKKKDLAMKKEVSNIITKIKCLRFLRMNKLKFTTGVK